MLLCWLLPLLSKFFPHRDNYFTPSKIYLNVFFFSTKPNVTTVFKIAIHIPNLPYP